VAVAGKATQVAFGGRMQPLDTVTMTVEPPEY